MNLREIIEQLKQPFPIAAHKERQLPGGGRWFYIPWQTIRDRLDDVYPEWQVSYSQPAYLGDYCHITCTITIGDVSRSAPGNAPIQLLSNSGKDMSRGTPIERAIADAFKNAAESYGIARYLDDQAFVVKYMKGQNDMRGYKFATENNQLEAGARGIPKTAAIPKKNEVIPTPLAIDRNLVNAEIDSLIKRKSISIEEAKEIVETKYKVRSRQNLSDSQLIELLELLRLRPTHETTSAFK